MTARQVIAKLKEAADPDKAAFLPRFFKAGKGEYAEGDKFLGVVVPDQRRIAKEFRDLAQREVVRLLESQFHECRLTAVLILVSQFERAKNAADQKRVYDLYLQMTHRINNWDIVDASAHKIVGPFLNERSREPLYMLARSSDLWENRISIISTFHFIKQRDLGDTILISEILLDHPHDLIHKAVGWMLRELGKRDEKVLLSFIKAHYEQMPRTTLRYAIEKVPDEKRKQILTGRRNS